MDEDFVLHNRKQAISALIFGTSALFSKPGQTLAPLIGTWLLAKQAILSFTQTIFGRLHPPTELVSTTVQIALYAGAAFMYLFTCLLRARVFRSSRGRGLNFTEADCNG